ncbi:homoserine kinase [Bacteroidota bacterium]
MGKRVEIFCPATVANVGPGFDILGLALDAPGDVLRLEITKADCHIIQNETEVDIPLEPNKNVATIALEALLDSIGSDEKFKLTFLEKIPPGSGIGSSAASSAAAVFGANILLGRPYSELELVPFAMKGEEAASGSAHADNVAPALLGGIVLVRSYDPLDIIGIPGPDELFCSVVHPQISIATEDSRRILKTVVPLKTAITQCGNVAGLVTGLITGDFRLIRDSMHDVIAEPIRSFLIPEYKSVKEAALKAGALGCSISGSGPSIFALSQNKEIAARAGEAMGQVFTGIKIANSVFVSQVNKQGIYLL